MDISIKCDSLKAIYSVKNGMLRCVTPFEFTISQMPMIKVCICVLQTVYKNSGKIRYIFLSDSGCNSGSIYSFGAGFVRQQQIYKKSPGE